MIEANCIGVYIRSIKNPKLQYLVDNLVERYYDKLWKLPSSISGKHHPPDERGAIGLIRHICRVAKLCEEFVREFDLPQQDRDRLIAAALLHDISKCDINEWNGKEWVKDKVEDHLHPILSGLIVRRFYEAEFFAFRELQDDVEAVARLIERHMSHWYLATPKPETLLEHLFCLADYIPTSFEMKEVSQEKES